MKKFFTILSLIAIICMLLISCNNLNDVDTNENQNSSSNMNSNRTGSRNTFIQNDYKNLDNQDILDTLAPNDDKNLDDQDILDNLVPDDDKNLDNQDTPITVDTYIQVEYNPETEAKDNEFPFDSIILEQSGYKVVAAGKYYGNDFDNIKYYGSYYRIIDNYEDFSELTAWGNNIDESLFSDNFILVLHTYKNAYDTYYSHSKYNELNGKGRYSDFGLSESGKLMITEGKSCSAKEVVGEAPNYIEDYEVILPIETQETIYLVIPKAEMPNNIKLNGEIILFHNVIIEL